MISTETWRKRAAGSRPWKLLERGAKRLFLPQPVQARHTEYSMVLSVDGQPGQPSERLMDVAFKAIKAARSQDLSDIAARIGGRLGHPDEVIQLWPGEHYRLLAALVDVLKPKTVVEIGTAQGLSALAMLKPLPKNGRLTTFDLVPWTQYPVNCLKPSDFEDGRLVQELGDVSQQAHWEKHRQTLEKADLIFVDAAKDGQLERRLISLFSRLRFTRRPLIVFDDIRMWNMLDIWYELPWPKLDLTSFGHWTGTGLCEPPAAAEASNATAENPRPARPKQKIPA